MSIITTSIVTNNSHHKEKDQLPNKNSNPTITITPTNADSLVTTNNNTNTTNDNSLESLNPQKKLNEPNESQKNPPKENHVNEHLKLLNVWPHIKHEKR